MLDNTSVTAAQALFDLSKALRAFSRKLKEKVANSDDPFAPDMQKLTDESFEIAHLAGDISDHALRLIAPSVRDAIHNLKGQVDRAKDTLQTIRDTQRALSLVGRVVNIAVSVSTGNPLGAADSVIALANELSDAVDAASSG